MLVECAECFTGCWMWIGGFCCVYWLWCAGTYTDLLFIVYAAALFFLMGIVYASSDSAWFNSFYTRVLLSSLSMLMWIIWSCIDWTMNVYASVLLNGGAMAAIAEWRGGLFANCHRKFVKGGPLWRRHRPHLCVYMAEIWPSAIRHPPLITLVCLQSCESCSISGNWPLFNCSCLGANGMSCTWMSFSLIMNVVANGGLTFANVCSRIGAGYWFYVSNFP